MCLIGIGIMNYYSGPITWPRGLFGHPVGWTRKKRPPSLSTFQPPGQTPTPSIHIQISWVHIGSLTPRPSLCPYTG